ncbi:phosphate ABC transporter substrate-binding protein PstS [Phenylobacterium sp.]|uniref:phosphate ABC transporter substrate-binding protein PstS n=1 Tax=Phenylobacterium sp. TaxID=1871053 RepID=UPI0025CCFAB4|nr:phosphate ABC transporter substrate-binding protein PstS [Phenylobacterium sp.]
MGRSFQERTMLKKLGAAFGAALIISAATLAHGATISGAGSTFAAPLYSKWAEAYKTQDLNYQSIGSGGGIRQITANTVDFGASDKPLKPDDLATNNFVQFPTAIGGVVPVVNLPGIKSGDVKLTGANLADIYRGAIKKWNDPLLAVNNPGVNLPNLPITVVHRSDGSGTTFIFTTYLAAKAKHWATDVGANDAVQWPVGIGGKGNEGVAAFVKQTPGSIGYVEYAYAATNSLTYTLVQNKAGKFTTPTAAAFAAAAAGAKWSSAPGYYLLLIDQPAPDAWPISGATFVILHKNQANGRQVIAFFDWAFKNGDAAASSLAYVPLPAAVKDLIRKTAFAQVK